MNLRFPCFIIVLLLAASCASSNNASKTKWEKRLSKYKIGADANSIVKELGITNVPVRYTPNLPADEELALYFLPDGTLHIATRIENGGNPVISSPPFFVPSNDSTTRRLSIEDQAWAEFVKQRSNVPHTNSDSK